MNDFGLTTMATSHTLGWNRMVETKAIWINECADVLFPKFLFNFPICYFPIFLFNFLHTYRRRIRYEYIRLHMSWGRHRYHPQNIYDSIIMWCVFNYSNKWGRCSLLDDLLLLLFLLLYFNVTVGRLHRQHRCCCCCCYCRQHKLNPSNYVYGKILKWFIIYMNVNIISL